MRGLVVPLTPQQVVTRALYLVGARSLADLDEHVRKAGAPPQCPAATYKLKTYNGGKDPTAPDPFVRWVEDGVRRISADCIGGAAWCSGFDRYQPVRFAAIYDGWINTDSAMMDARGPAKCFEDLGRPEPGCMIVCRSGSRGHKIGHVGIVVSVPPEWDQHQLGCWQALGVVDVAGRSGRANMRTTGRGWFRTEAGFLVSKMV